MAAQVAEAFGAPESHSLSDRRLSNGAPFHRRSSCSTVVGDRRGHSLSSDKLRFCKDEGAGIGRNVHVTADRCGDRAETAVPPLSSAGRVLSPVEPDGTRSRAGCVAAEEMKATRCARQFDAEDAAASAPSRDKGGRFDSRCTSSATSDPAKGSDAWKASRSEPVRFCSQTPEGIPRSLPHPFVGLPLFLVFSATIAACSGIQSAALRDYRFNSKNVTALLDSLLAKNHYDNRIRPDFGGPPVLVTVNMHIKSMGPVSETDEMYAMDCYFRQVWYDRRLRFNLSGLNEFSMSWLFLERVWKPDTFFMNGKKSYLHRITVPNKFIRLRSDGFLTYSMNTFSVISVFFFLKRHTGYFMLQVYVPCGLIVSCSWVSFWIDPDAVPARVSLGVTTVLSMTTMGFGGRSQMPKVSYATALDWFVILCFSFVFAVMVEYAAINFIDKIRTDLKRKMEEERKKREAKEGGEGGEEEGEEERKKRQKKEGVRRGGAEVEGKRPEGYNAPGNMVLGGVGDHGIVRVVVETVGDEPVQKGKEKGALPTAMATEVDASQGARDNVEWEDETDEFDEDEEELDVLGNGAGPEDVVEMAVSDSADRLGVGCDADLGRAGSSLRRARSVTASPVDTPRWQHTLLAPVRAWRTSRLMSREDLGSVMLFWGAQGEQGPPGGANGTAGDAADASVPAGKFSRIDIVSRRMFPIMFFTLISIYWVAYMYYITDEYEGWTAEEKIGPKRNVVFVAGED